MDNTLFAKAKLTTLDYEICGINKKEAKEFLIEEINDELGLNNVVTLQKRHAFFKIPQTQPNDFQTFLFESDHLNMLAGIRHFNLNPLKPFIQVSLSSYHINQKQFAWIKAILAKQFSVFQPKQFCLWLHPQSLLIINFKPEIKQQWLAATLGEIRSQDKPLNYNDIQLKKVVGKGYLVNYQKWYQEFHLNQPNLIDDVAVNDEETMETSRKQNLLYWAIYQNQKVGLIAAEAELLMGKQALYFNEIVLDPAFKGKKLASAIQRKFIEKRDKEFELVWGTIDAKNRASTKTAEKVGRKVMRCECFFNL